MAIYYISDLHLGHENAIKFDNRPFANIKEMHDTILDNWNSRVTGNDTVYILGDMIWAKEHEWPFYLGPLAGNKVLIRGNHDPKEFSATTRKFFQDIKDYKEIKDEGRKVVLCHYPIPFFNFGFAKECYMLYGHVHTTVEYEYLKEMRKTVMAHSTGHGTPSGNFINVGCMMPWMNYTPRTLDEIIEREREYRSVE